MSIAQRELKFRAYDDVKNKMYYLGEEENVVFAFESTGIVATDITEGEEEFRTLYHLKYMQSTGLKDKNGVEIYENDLVRRVVHDKPYVVQGNGWMDVDVHEGLTEEGEVKFLYSMWFLDTGNEKGSPLEFDEDQVLEVVGNIYEGDSHE